MERKRFNRWLIPVIVFAGLWVSVRYLLPVLLPFLLGTLVALSAEPAVRFLQEKLRIPRGIISFFVISMGLFMLIALICVLGAVAYRELRSIASELPAFFKAISVGVEKFRQWAIAFVSRAPDGLRTTLTQWVGDFFAGGSVFLEKAAAGVLGMAGNIMGVLPGGAMLVGTAVISSFMISAQLPALQAKMRSIVQQDQIQKWKLALQKVKEAVAGWVKAQLKLSGVSFCIVSLGFLLLRISNPVFWAAIVALVDAVPLLGTGTILIPWALLALIRGDGVLAIGLAGVYITAMLVRSALEPKMVGRHLGINPLITLVALYAGYRLWGVGGMILAPILTVTAKQLIRIG